jgi:hypothetical protein
VDVYAFGIVLYELLSAKEAIVRSTEFTDAQGLSNLVIYPFDQFSICNISFQTWSWYFLVSIRMCAQLQIHNYSS